MPNFVVPASRIMIAASLMVVASLSPTTIAFADKTILIAAAASVRPPLTEIVAEYRAASGTETKLTFGASGQLATQIENGAPFDVFLSADEANATRLVEQKLTVDRGAIYALGPLAIFAPEQSTIEVDGELNGIQRALVSGDLKKLAIANPKTAPYGVAAKAALETAGVWSEVEPKLAIGENIAQTLVFATDGGADAALVALSLLVGPDTMVSGRHAVVSSRLAPPLRHRIVVMASASPQAAGFAAFILSAKAKAIFAKYGFSSPDGP